MNCKLGLEIFKLFTILKFVSNLNRIQLIMHTFISQEMLSFNSGGLRG